MKKRGEAAEVNYPLPPVKTNAPLPGQSAAGDAKRFPVDN
jgi:hypothetical protein